jgi:uncharacterized protein (TIGR02594 family)
MASGGEMIATQHYDLRGNEPKYFVDALKDMGIQEWVLEGKKKVSNPTVQRYVAKALHKPEWKGSTISTPWCAYWVNAKLEYAGITGTVDGMARSFRKWGEVIDKNDDTKWNVGDVAYMWRGRSDDGITGHVGFLVGWDRTYFYMIGGNQGDKVCIQRFPRSKLLGVRRPRSIWRSQTVQKAAGSAVAETTSQVVQAAMPEPSSWVHTGDKVAETAQTLQDPLYQLATWKPWIVGVLSAIAIGLALWAAYHRFVDKKEGFNS